MGTNIVPTPTWMWRITALSNTKIVITNNEVSNAPYPPHGSPAGEAEEIRLFNGKKEDVFVQFSVPTTVTDVVQIGDYSSVDHYKPGHQNGGLKLGSLPRYLVYFLLL
ncbi:unnamed protein product, partial [Brenthis ino]